MKEVEYPLWCKSKHTSLVVKFTGLMYGEVVVPTAKCAIGTTRDDWIPHTNKEDWEDVTEQYMAITTPHSALDVQIGGSHHKDLKIQPMEYSMANNLDACQHTIIKYVTRFRNKNGTEDLEKAKHTIDLLIEWEMKKC